MSHSGLSSGRGSVANTSKYAPPTCPDSNAVISALLIHQVAPRHVDEPRPLFHRREFLNANHPHRLRRSRRAQHHVITPSTAPQPTHPRPTICSNGPTSVPSVRTRSPHANNPHPHRPASLCYRRPDLACPDDTDNLSSISSGVYRSHSCLPCRRTACGNPFASAIIAPITVSLSGLA